LLVTALRLQDIDLKLLIPRQDIDESTRQLKGVTGLWNGKKIAARMPIRGRVVALPVGLADVQHGPNLVWLREVSAGGRAIMAAEELLVNSLLLLGSRATPKPRGMHWELTQIRNRREEGKGHILYGLQVIRDVEGDEIERILSGNMEAVLAICTLPEDENPPKTAVPPAA
jgi:hypothetical protein